MPPKRAANGAAIAKAVKKEKIEESASGSESGSESGSASESEDEAPKKSSNAKKTTNSDTSASSADNCAPSSVSPAETAPIARSTGPTIVRKNDKANMVFPKGTFVIRLADLDKPELNWLWRVDNHQLLQKYFLIADHAENDGPRQWYEKSNRYTGWFCNEKWKFLEVKVVKREGKDDKIKVVYPSQEKRDNAKKICEEEEKKNEVDDD